MTGLIPDNHKWRPVVGWEDLYEVSDDGRVYSVRTGQLLGVSLSEGYPSVRLTVNRRSRSYRIHVLIAAAFIGPRPLRHDVMHLDGNRENSTLANLAYGTHSENQLMMAVHGTNVNARKTHCPQGHEYTPENTRYARPRSRVCVTCQRARSSRKAGVSR